ncbi:PREDICTED: uncharacterized protein LOC105570204 isoform X3 [Vollenhovia emeryi]|uniref:uncharacterized protein LOC105570204 isoform X3 n=1 Tax=Vollenhovia emeryi TaxID=411798 RepID=UPI0005F546FB|nr:PREDICTED: uncharacterized protein LOC105570204 isoform X3 [Vollenhovia emeryi]
MASSAWLPCAPRVSCNRATHVAHPGRRLSRYTPAVVSGVCASGILPSGFQFAGEADAEEIAECILDVAKEKDAQLHSTWESASADQCTYGQFVDTSRGPRGISLPRKMPGVFNEA